jgi:hypothetical protein
VRNEKCVPGLAKGSLEEIVWNQPGRLQRIDDAEGSLSVVYDGREAYSVQMDDRAAAHFA